MATLPEDQTACSPRENLMHSLCFHARDIGAGDDFAVHDPIEPSEAREFVQGMLGAVSEHRLCVARNQCWAKLIAATTAEQRLSLERLINALSEGLGMLRHEEAAAIIQRNIAATEARHKKRMADCALDRWRYFTPKSVTDRMINEVATIQHWADGFDQGSSAASKSSCSASIADAPSSSSLSLND